MNINKTILTIAIVIMLILIYIPNFNSEALKFNSQNSKISFIKPEVSNNNPKAIELSVYRCKADGNIEKNEKILTFKEKEELFDKINKIAESKSSIRETFDNSMQLLKQYDLISNESSIEEFIDIEKIGDNISNSILDFDNVTNENFLAHMALVLVIGGGFGLGLGMPGMRGVNGFTSFLAIVAGLGVVLCIDFLDQTVYMLITYLLPLLIGYFAGYMGFIIFAVEPGTFYSNLVMLGFAPMTAWIQIPDISR